MPNVSYRRHNGPTMNNPTWLLYWRQTEIPFVSIAQKSRISVLMDRLFAYPQTFHHSLSRRCHLHQSKLEYLLIQRSLNLPVVRDGLWKIIPILGVLRIQGPLRCPCPAFLDLHYGRRTASDLGIETKIARLNRHLNSMKSS